MSSNKLDELIKKKKQLEAKIKDTEKRLAAKERKDDTRRKILIGAYYLEQHSHNKTMNNLVSKLDGFLTRDSDRALFGLNNQTTTPA